MTQRLLAVLFVLGVLATLGPRQADAQYFGRNKVQYRSFDFQIIHTEHFDLYFYEQEREAALDVAKMAERAYARLSRLLRHEFQEKKPIILYASHADFQQTNTIRDFLTESTGAFAEPLRGRIVIPLTGSYADFDHVFRHELVHSFQHDIMFRNAAMTNANPFATRLPLWFTEGMAEYLSIGHIDPITAATVRDATLSGYIRTIGEMNRIDDYYSYRFGQALWAYVGSRWGDEVIGIILQKATRIGMLRAFDSTLGMSLAELNQEWLETVRRTYLPQVVDFQRPTSFARAVLRHEKLEDPSYMAPAISPDGKLMAVFSARDGFFPDLWLADAQTGEFKRRLVESSQEADFESLRFLSSAASFSPDGRYLAFVAQTGGRDALYIYDVQENELAKKLEYELNAIMNPTWSPDGRRIAFAGLDGGLSDLFITDLDGNLQRLTSDRYADLFPAWSPDGRWIAFSTDRGEGTDLGMLTYAPLRVALFDVASGEIRVLPGQEARNVNPVWSPDSRSLIWVGDRTGTKDLYLFDRNTRTLSSITHVLSGIVGLSATDMAPVLSWARDEGTLLFAYFEAAGQSIFAVDDPLRLPRTPVSELPGQAQPLPIIAQNEPAREPAAAPAADGVPGSDGADSAVTAATGSDGAAPGSDGVEPGTADSVVVASDTAAAEPGITVTAGSSFYRHGGAFRPSNEIPEGVEAPEPISVMALLDSTEYVLPDTSDFDITDYNVKFAPDMIGRPTIGAQVGGYYGNGVYGGSFISLSDMLGNHNILVAGSINGSFSDAAFFGGYNFLKTRANYGISLMQQPLYRYGGPCCAVPVVIDGQPSIVDALQFQRDLIRVAQGVVSYPFSTFQRLEFGASGVMMQRDYILRGVNLTRGRGLDYTERLWSAKYIEPSLALVFDNSYFGWTGPIVGRRYRFQVSRSLGDLSFTEGLVDFRNYLNIGRKLVFATRLLSRMRLGGNSDVFQQFWGGPYFLRGYGGDSFDPNGAECDPTYGNGQVSVAPCPAATQLLGSNVAMMNAELRFPIITELQIGFLGNFPPVDAVAFFDGGLAWSNSACLTNTIDDVRDPFAECQGETRDIHLVWDRKPGQDPFLFREPLFSYGVGLRINVFYTVLRLDYAFPLNRPDRHGKFSLSFGPSF
ncbi:MAG TPA: BamA/TamA family outer membrane protein [Longimicrobiales bacterium]